ncbi:NACHT domain-containing protein [Amycolatopsis sp. NPDC021455]|uniref:NACHT domain-containing protein n=1 Tax=Amycolatopsis sp. NPDC021455 TaxID=3154901 RepID=UPI0033FA7477
MLKVGAAVVNSAVKSWLTSRKSEFEQQSSLAELVQARTGGGFFRRRFDREIEALVDVVSERLLLLCRQEVPNLDDGERSAALAEVVDAFERADLADADLFEVDVDPAKLARRLRATLPDAAERAGLSEAGTWFHRRVLEECCGYYVRLVVHLTPFAARAGAELLGRVSGLAEQLERVLNRLPAPSLMAPDGTASDAEFRSRYLRQISETLDDLELFGVDTRSYRPRTTLSVAYVSLTVRDTGADSLGPAHEMLSWRGDAMRGQDGSVRAERALATAGRILIRGEAGSGKSTLLRWLAINAARGTFRDELAGLNGYIPFLIKLRSYSGRRLPSPEEFLDGTAQALTALMPSAWVHRQLASGRAIVLVDGVDELTADERAAVRAWLKDLIQAFPEIRLVLTSRPSAAAKSWLSAEGFNSAWIEHMSQADVRALVRHWHKAVREVGSLPCAEEDLPRYEGVLLSRLDGNAHLRALATTPLLCAMLCALNLDRASFLPRNRLELYVTALSMLLERRDAERRIPASLKIGNQESRQLLRHLAWRLSVNGRSELSREEALRRLSERLATMPRVDHDAEQLLDHLVQRSGIVREPAPGRIDFVHRTFQEFLTAEEAADQGDVGLLVQNAHLDQWRDIIVMAAGLANAPLREQLFQGLFDRADAEPRTRRKLRLLAAAATESAPALTIALAERMESALTALIPPRSKAEARSLAAGGEVLLPRLLDTPADLSEAMAAATVRTAALINGPDAWPVLEKFSRDPRPAVQKELIAAWSYFDPDEYAARVLADAPLLGGHLWVDDQVLLPAVPRLRHLNNLSIDLRDFTDLEVLPRLPYLRLAQLAGDFEDLAPLARCTELETLLLAPRGAVDPRGLSGFPNLQQLFFYPGVASLTDLGFFRSMASLSSLGLERLEEVEDFSPLGDLRNLTGLSLYRYSDGVDFGFLRNLTDLRFMDFGRTVEGAGLGIRGGLCQLAVDAPGIRRLGFLDVQPLAELEHIARFSALEELSIRYCQVEDFTPLTTVGSLRVLATTTPIDPGQLAQIARITQLTTLDILSSHQDRRNIDLAGLGDVRLTVRAYGGEHRIVGAGPRIKVKWL